MNRIMFIDIEKCTGCYACSIACKLEHHFPPHPTKPPVGDPEGPELIRVHQVGPEIINDEAYLCFVPISCMHCSDAPCIRACPESAIYKDARTGTTLVNQDKCIGCTFCLRACPYGAPQYHEGRLHLCDLCNHRLEEGKQTACEAVCPARAIHVGTAREISERVGQKAAERAGNTRARKRSLRLLPARFKACDKSNVA